MSLNWQMPENCDKSLLNLKTRYEGKEDETMHPVLYRLIFLSMTLGCDYTKKIDDVMERIQYLNVVSPDLVELHYGKDAIKGEVFHNNEWIPFDKYYKVIPEYNKDGLSGNVVKIDREWIEKYWGLSTNVGYKSFSKFFTDYNKRTLELIRRGYKV